MLFIQSGKASQLQHHRPDELDLQHDCASSKRISSYARLHTPALANKRPGTLACERLGSHTMSLAGMEPNNPSARSRVWRSCWRASDGGSASTTWTSIPPGNPIAETPSWVSLLPSIHAVRRVQSLSEVFKSSTRACSPLIRSARRYSGHRAAPDILPCPQE